MTTRIKAKINIQIKRKYLLFNENIFRLFIFLFPDPLTPKGVPHELHTNLPDKPRSALRLELPQTKHLFPIIRV